MVENLFCIIDKEQAFIDLKTQEVLSLLGVNMSMTEHVSDLAFVGQNSLLENNSVYILHLNDKDDIQKCINGLLSLRDIDLQQKIKNGLIITTCIPRTATRKLENTVSKLGGKVVLLDKKNPALELMSELQLSKDVKQYLMDYAGTDYAHIIPILSGLSKLSQAQQRKISVYDLICRLPKPKGALLPWEIDKPLYSQDRINTVETYRRVRLHTHYLPILSLIKKRVWLSFKIAVLREVSGITAQGKLSEALDETNNYPFKLAVNLSTNVGLKKLHKALVIIEKLESDLKGGSKIDADKLFEFAVIRLNALLVK